VELNLSAQEQEFLIDTLEERYLHLQREIPRTDHREFKQKLRTHEALIESILDRLRGTTVAQAS